MLVILDSNVKTILPIIYNPAFVEPPVAVIVVVILISVATVVIAVSVLITVVICVTRRRTHCGTVTKNLVECISLYYISNAMYFIIISFVSPISNHIFYHT